MTKMKFFSSTLSRFNNMHWTPNTVDQLQEDEYSSICCLQYEILYTFPAASKECCELMVWWFNSDHLNGGPKFL